MNVSLERPPERSEVVEVEAERAPDVLDRGLSGHRARRVGREFARRWEGSRTWRVTTAVMLPVLWGAIAGWWTPRGPLDTGEALLSIVVSAAIGGIAGHAWRSRWALLVSPALFMGAVELARLGVDGPTVDRPAFSTYGLMAFAVGRGFHALVSLAPMVLGAAIGFGSGRSADAHRRPRTGWARATRRVAVGVAAVGLIACSIALVRPARTDAIVDEAGRGIEGSIAELTTVDVNGHELSVLIRGHSVDDPVLLFLAGGPGGSEMGAMRNHLEDLERHFIVVTWDQRGTGKSYAALDPTDTLTLDGAVDDTVAVTNILRERFGQDRVLLVGQSWGSTLGVLAAQRHPELYSGFVGVGQMVSQLATDRIFYDDTLAWARRHGNDGLVAELVKIGPPPYTRMLDYETALSYEHEVYPYDHSANSEGEGGFSENLLVEEYTLVEQVHLLAAFMDTFSVMYPQLQDIDFRTQVSRLDVPVFFVQGAHEARGRAVPFDEWFTLLDAPSKGVVTFDTSGHRPMFEQPDEFVAYMVDTVLPALEGATR
jgi:proline iminopeptidase